MKAQSAVEYLTTYGWMFVSLAIASGAIYSFVGGQCVESTTGFTGSDVQVQDFGIRPDSANMSLLIQNQADNTVTIDSIKVTGPEGKRRLNYSETVPTGEEEQTDVVGFEQTDACNTMDVEIVYDLGVLEDQYVTGEITSNIEVSDKSYPEPFESVSAELN